MRKAGGAAHGPATAARQILLLIAALLALAPRAAAAHAVEAFYKGRQIRLIIALDAGDDYDLWARAIGRHIGRHISGRPNLVAENMPGGGQIVGTNYLFNVAPKDGSAIGMVVSPRSGLELAAIITQFMQAPPELAAKAEALGHP